MLGTTNEVRRLTTTEVVELGEHFYV